MPATRRNSMTGRRQVAKSNSSSDKTRKEKLKDLLGLSSHRSNISTDVESSMSSVSDCAHKESRNKHDNLKSKLANAAKEATRETANKIPDDDASEGSDFSALTDPSVEHKVVAQEPNERPKIINRRVSLSFSSHGARARSETMNRRASLSHGRAASMTNVYHKTNPEPHLSKPALVREGRPALLGKDVRPTIVSPTYQRKSQRTLLGMCGAAQQRRFSALGNSGASSHGDTQTLGSHDDSPCLDDVDSFCGVNSSGEPDFEVVMAVVNSWEFVKGLDNYQEALAEQMILRMMELDDSVRKDLQLFSIRSSKFDQVCEKIIGVVDGLVSFLGPDLEDFYDQIVEVGERYKSDGFQEHLLVPALVNGLKFVVPADDFPSDIQKSWTTVMNFMVSKMET